MITDCPSGKVRYPTRHWAEHFATRLNAAGRYARAYDCEECGGAHVTSARFAHREWRATWMEAGVDAWEDVE